MHTNCGQPTPAEVRHEHEVTRELSATLKHAHSVVIAKMMKRQSAKNEIVRLGCVPFQKVSFHKGDFRITGTEFLCDLKRGRLSIQRIDAQLSANLAPVLRDQSRNIARAGGKIDNAQARAGFDPTAEKKRDQCVTSEPAIELPDVFEIALQFGRNRLRPIHQFELSRIKSPLH